MSSINGDKYQPRTVDNQVRVVGTYTSRSVMNQPKYLSELDVLEYMTKSQLLDWALTKGHDLVDSQLKAEIKEQCVAIANGTYVSN